MPLQIDQKKSSETTTVYAAKTTQITSFMTQMLLGYNLH